MILITGATGLVGCHLLAYLLPKEVKIKALYRTKKKKDLSIKVLKSLLKDDAETLFHKIEWVKADINDVPELTNAFKGITYVYHCAGLISFDVRDYKKLRRTNIEGTANVVNLALAKNIKKLCHVSSIVTLGSELNNKPITEASPRNNEATQSNYSITKYGAEMEVWRACQEGLDVVIVNPGIIIGAGFWNSGSGLLFKKIDKNLRFHFPKVTGFVAVEDVITAMTKLMKSEIKNENFILVSESLSFKEVLYSIAKNLKKPIPKKPIKKWMIVLGWVYQSFGNFLFGSKKVITYESIKGAFSKTYYNNSKLPNHISFNYTPIQSAIEKTAKAYLS